MYLCVIITVSEICSGHFKLPLMLLEKKYDALGLNVVEKGQHILFLLLFHIEALKQHEKLEPQTKCLPHKKKKSIRMFPQGENNFTACRENQLRVETYL